MAQQLMLDALRTHLTETSPENDTAACAPPDGEALVAVLSLAAAHKNLPLIYEGLHTLLPMRTELPADIAACMQEYRHRTYQTVIGQTTRTLSFLQLYEALAAEGIRPLVVKGIVCRALYPKPDHRPSSDEDILIPPAQFAACDALFRARGATLRNPTADRHDGVPAERGYVFSDGLYIELHTSFFSGDDGITTENEQRLFPDLFENTMSVTVEHTTIDTPSAQNHLLYLLLHAYKHFVHAGFGIRQVSDIALFAKHYAAALDFARLRADCASVRCAPFAAAVFCIADTYLGIPVALGEAWAPLLAETDCMPLLVDILSGGIYGGTDGSRLHSTTLTLDAARRGSRKQTSVLHTLFPPRASLVGRYPYLSDKPGLLPVAWAQRIFTYAKETRGKGEENSAKESLRIAEARLQLLAYYGIIDCEN